MRAGVTDMSQRIQSLHHYSLAVCVVVGLIVFGAMGYTMFAHRRSRHPVPATFHENTKVEIVWTLIPSFDSSDIGCSGNAGSDRHRRQQ